MRRAASLSLVCLTALAWATSRAQEPDVGAPERSQRADEIVWRRDLTAAREEARAAGKPLLLVFRCEP